MSAARHMCSFYITDVEMLSAGPGPLFKQPQLMCMAALENYLFVAFFWGHF